MYAVGAHKQEQSARLTREVYSGYGGGLHPRPKRIHGAALWCACPLANPGVDIKGTVNHDDCASGDIRDLQRRVQNTTHSRHVRTPIEDSNPRDRPRARPSTRAATRTIP